MYIKLLQRYQQLVISVPKIMDKEEQGKDSLISQVLLPAEGEQDSPEEEEALLVQRSWFQRTFGRMQKGSLRISVFTLMASAMGTGLFSFPFIASQVGFLMVIFDIFVGCLFSLTSMYLLMAVALPKGVKSYNQLAAISYGNWLKRVSEFCIIIYSWGITICFQVIFAKFVVEVSNQIFKVEVYSNKKTHELNHTGNTIRLVANAVNISVNMIFILKRNLYSLRFITLLGTLFVFYNASVILVTAFIGFTDLQELHVDSIVQRRDWSSLKLFNFDHPLQQMAGIASTIFCFVNHQMIFPLAHQLKRPSQRRLRSIFNRAHFFESSVYLTVAIFGYLLLFEQTIEPVCLESIPTKAMLVGKCLMMVTLFFAVPLNTLPARQMFFNSFGLDKDNNKLHVLVSCGFAFIGCGIAMVFVKVNSYFGLLGGSCGTLMAGTIPAMMWLKLTPRPLDSPLPIFVIVFYSIMTCVGFTGAIVSVIH